MPGLLRGVARTAVVAGTATAVSGRVQRRQADKYAERDAHAAAQRSAAYEEEMGAQQQQQQYAPPQPQYAAPPQQQYAAPPEPPPVASQEDLISQLKQLGELRDSGILTEDEFAAQKAKLLG
ncbi:MAG TPA: SHOCT domain-containing protein [Ornithinibacter sp.]|nr:SHOCT domain-containing protein [Ornithinibacter sp.]